MKQLKSKQEFRDAVRAASSRADEHLAYLSPIELAGTEYQLWGALLHLVHDAIDSADWTAVRSLLSVYDAVERAGVGGEMYEASYVAFLEDVRLPRESAKLREFWRHAPPLFTAALKQARGLR